MKEMDISLINGTIEASPTTAGFDFATALVRNFVKLVYVIGNFVKLITHTILNLTHHDIHLALVSIRKHFKKLENVLTNVCSVNCFEEDQIIGQLDVPMNEMQKLLLSTEIRQSTTVYQRYN